MTEEIDQIEQAEDDIIVDVAGENTGGLAGSYAHFNRQLLTIEQKLVKRIRQFPRQVIHPLIRDLARKTPHRGMGFGKRKDGSLWYSGRAVANWTVEPRPGRTHWLVPDTPSRDELIRKVGDRAKFELLKMSRLGVNNYYVVNPVFYLQYLNRGWSRQARSGYIDAIIEAHKRRAVRVADKHFTITS